MASSGSLHPTLLVLLLLTVAATASTTTTFVRAGAPPADLAERLDGVGQQQCWGTLLDVKSCTGEIILFFLNGEAYLGPGCCRAIRVIEQRCWAAALWVSVIGFAPEEGDLRQGYCDAGGDDDNNDVHVVAIWSSCVPNRVKIFAWLMFRDRLNSKCNLLRKHIVTASLCPRCGHDGETSAHIFLACPLAQRIWQRIGLSPSSCIDGLWDCRLPTQVDAVIWHSVLLIILWKIWDSRNAMTFRQQNHHSIITLRRIIDDLMLWTHRMKKPLHKQAASSWRSYLLSRLHVLM